MVEVKKNLPPGAKRFEFKAGVEGFTWKGMRTEGDPSSNAPNQPRMLVNLLPRGGGYVPRAGSAAFNSTAFQSSVACIRLIADYQLKTNKKLWMLGDGCPGVSSSAGFFIASLDQEQKPEFQRITYYSTLVSSVAIASFDKILHIGADAGLRKLQLIAQPYGTENITAAGSGEDTPIYTFSGFVIRCLMTFDGLLFIGLDGGAGASKIATWDGLAIRDDLTGINPPLAFGAYRIQNGGDAIVVGFASGTNHIRIRGTGTSPGTWTTVTPSAGTVAVGQTNSMVSYKDVLYLADGSTNVWSYNGTTLAVARVPALATAVRTVEVFNGLLYFGYETLTSARIGKYDGTTWTDVEKNLTTQFTTPSSIRSLRGYRNCLLASGVSGVSGGRLWFSPETATSGTWTEITPNSAFNGEIEYLLVA